MSRFQELDVGRGRKDKKGQISEVSFIDETRTTASGSSRWKKSLFFGFQVSSFLGDWTEGRRGRSAPDVGGDRTEGTTAAVTQTDGLVQEMIVSAVFSFK
jgi:hypothetical protein